MERLAVRDNYCTVYIMDDTQMITKNNNLAETDELADLLSSLPKEKSWRSGYVYRYQGFWCPEKQVPAVEVQDWLICREYFHALYCVVFVCL
ncbi:hypothetical protein OIU77_026525 [Salix suchowensis]|uniref:Uncharacterized protein n=1 Tax=Salix suchowensis TaxID=1278906 RepID=A0ABQ9BPP7_9ROSI|nr:hypothetical protein OIU77_026525 [Salix suchowensis]